MNLSNARATFGLNCRATPTSSSVTGSVQVGASNTSVALPNANVAYAVRAIFAGSGKTFTLATTTNTVSAASAWTAGAAQVETATAAGNISASGAGNASVTVTAAGMTGSPKTLLVPVANSDTAAIWAGKVRTALAADAAVSALFTVGGTSTAISLTRKPTQTFTVPGGTLPLYAANDATLNIALANGTSTGITAAATSANTTAGVLTAGVKIYDDATDFEGVTIPTIATKAMLFSNAGAVVNVSDGANFLIDIGGGGLAAFSGDGTSSLMNASSLIATADATTDLSITVIGQTV